MPDLVKTWKIVTRLLQSASSELRANRREEIGSDDEQFEELLAHNELGLAWEKLADCAGDTASRSFWLLMMDAAREMSMTEAEVEAANKLGAARLTA
jgi:hypothetical protein